MVTFLKFIGFIISVIPFPVLEKFTHLLSWLLLSIPNKRRRIILSNLTYAFPEWSFEQIVSTAKKSAALMFEMGLFSFKYPYFSKDAKRHLLTLNSLSESNLKKIKNYPGPVLILIPHVALFEVLAASPTFRPSNGRKLGAIYRPNRSKGIDNYIRQSRKNTGMEVFSREDALWDAKKFLKKPNWLVILFDQNAGLQGCHSSFLNRFASISNLPGLWAKSTNAKVVFAFPKRISFFKCELELKEINGRLEDCHFEAHKILEKLILNREGLPEWLWSHERWKTQQNYRFHLRHRHKRVNLESTIPKTTKFWVRMPNWLGDVVMTIPLIKAIRIGRPDAAITLIAKKEFEGVLTKLNIADEFISLPYGSKENRYDFFHRLRRKYPSVIINFANSLRSDLESLFIGAPNRYGMCLPGRYRPLLTHSYELTREQKKNIQEIHQVKLWESMLQYFGLNEELDYTSHALGIKRFPNKIGILPGSANNPAKRWPISNWAKLIGVLFKENQDLEFHLYGSGSELEVIDSIMSKTSGYNVLNRCGKTDLVQLMDEVSSCNIVIGNDSGGMHLANYLGVKTVVLFGPTNSKVTRPIFGENSTVLHTEFIESESEIRKIANTIGNMLKD